VIKRSGPDAENSFPSNSDERNVWSFYLHFHTRHHDVIKHRDSVASPFPHFIFLAFFCQLLFLLFCSCRRLPIDAESVHSLRHTRSSVHLSVYPHVPALLLLDRLSWNLVLESCMKNLSTEKKFGYSPEKSMELTWRPKEFGEYYIAMKLLSSSVKIIRPLW